MIRAAMILLLSANLANADTILAARTIPAKALIGPGDIMLHDGDIPGGISDAANIIGMEARVALYAGRPIRQGDVGQPAVVERNQIVTLHYHAAGILISTEGRALGRAGPGEIVPVMNLSSRTTVRARIGADGMAYVQY